MKNKILFIVSLFFGIVLAGVEFWFRINNPDKTEMRLLIDYWPVYVGLAIVIPFFIYSFRKMNR